jgi:type IV pilus assembly protein PilM
MKLPFNFKFNLDKFKFKFNFNKLNFRSKEIFKPKEKFSLGIDIGAHSIKTVKFKFTETGPELCNFAVEPAQLDNLDSLRKIRQSFATDSVNVSVSGPSTVIRCVNFPKMSESELKQALKFEAQKHIPFSLEQVNVDSFILKDNLPDGKMLILLAATKKELVEQRIKALQDAGFNINIIDIDSISLINAFNFNYSQEEIQKLKTIALLNLGASVSNLNILENGIPRLSRDINVAGDDFTRKIKDALNIDYKAAEQLKNNPQDKEYAKAAAVFEPIYTNLCTAVRTSFDYYESQSVSSVAKIYLSGGASRLKGLRESVAELLGIEVECWDALKQIAVPAEIDRQKLNELSPQLAVAVGLALRQ